MSKYLQMRFKGVVKNEYRNVFEPIALDGKWAESPIEVLREFGVTHLRPERIPCSDSGQYIVQRWNDEPFRRAYNKLTGEWQFQTDINIYNDGSLTVDFENEIIPFLMESAEVEFWLEPICDEPNVKESQKFVLKDGKLVFVGMMK